jgi:hypothetical protein
MSSCSKLKKYAYFKDNEDAAFLDIQLVRESPFVLTYPGQSTREKVNEIFAAAKITPNIALMTQNVITAAHMCSKTPYVTLLPRSYQCLLSDMHPVSYFILKANTTLFGIFPHLITKRCLPRKLCRSSFASLGRTAALSSDGPAAETTQNVKSEANVIRAGGEVVLFIARKLDLLCPSGVWTRLTEEVFLRLGRTGPAKTGSQNKPGIQKFSRSRFCPKVPVVFANNFF